MSFSILAATMLAIAGAPQVPVVLPESKLLGSLKATFKDYESAAVSGDTIVAGVTSFSFGEVYVFEGVTGIALETQQLVRPDGDDGDYGRSVAISGDTILISSPNDDDVAPGAGSAYVFVRSGSTWTLQTELHAAGSVAGDWVGYSVALDGDTAVLGARLDDTQGASAGAAWVFTRTGTIWSQQAKLLAGNGAAGDDFGESVAIDGDTIVVGAPDGDGIAANTGSAYVFVRSGTAWTQEARLEALDGIPADMFGFAVDVEGDTALVGSWRGGVSVPQSGSAYVFLRSGAAWSLHAELENSSPVAAERFGYSVSLSGERALVGASARITQYGAEGAAHLFSRSSGTWTETAELRVCDSWQSDQLGYAVCLDGDRAAVAAKKTEIGCVYGFVLDGGPGGLPAPPGKLAPATGAQWDAFGKAVAVDGGTVAVGAWQDDTQAENSGAVHVYERAGTTWGPPIKLLANDGGAMDSRFGVSVDLEGDTLAGGRYDSVLVYVRSGTTWAEQAALAPAGQTLFGFSLSLSGDTLLVGAPGDPTMGYVAGAAHVWVRSGTTWTEQAKLVPFDGTGGERYGSAVAIDGDLAIVGAFEDTNGLSTNVGSAYCYSRSGTTWTLEARLVPPGDPMGARFGNAVSLSDDTAVIGSYGALRVHFFRRTGGFWQGEGTASYSNLGQTGPSNFGESVAVEGDLAAIGTPGDVEHGRQAGSVAFYRRGGASWSFDRREYFADVGDLGGAGTAVALDGGLAVVGASGACGPAGRTGAAYLTLTEPDAVNYCTAKTNSCSGQPAIAWTGVSSASASSGFTITGSGAREGKTGLLFYTKSGRGSFPFQGGILCVDPGFGRRAKPVVATGGTPGPTCDATFAIDFNAFASGALGGNHPVWASHPGQQLDAQWWGRDTILNGSYLSNAIEFTVGL